MIGDRIYDEGGTLKPILAHPWASPAAQFLATGLRSAYMLAQLRAQGLTSRAVGTSISTNNGIISATAAGWTRARIGSGWLYIPAEATDLIAEVEFEYIYTASAAIEHRIQVTQGAGVDTGSSQSFDPSTSPLPPIGTTPGIPTIGALSTAGRRNIVQCEVKLSNVTAGSATIVFVEVQYQSALVAVRHVAINTRWEAR